MGIRAHPPDCIPVSPKQLLSHAAASWPCSYPLHDEYLHRQGSCLGCGRVSPDWFLLLSVGSWITVAVGEGRTVLGLGQGAAQYYIGVPLLFVLDPVEDDIRPVGSSDSGVVCDGPMEPWMRPVAEKHRQRFEYLCGLGGVAPLIKKAKFEQYTHG